MKLFKVDYAMLNGDTVSYGYNDYTYAVSSKKAMNNIKHRLGKNASRIREATINELVEKVSAVTQLSMFV